MRSPIALLPLLSLLGTLTQALPAHNTNNIVGATYSLTNDLHGNNVIIHAIAPNGTVSYAGFEPTGGLGQHALGVTGPDAIYTQGPLEVFGNHLFVVNPVNSTVTMFNIDPTNPTRLSRVGKPVNSGGEFPNALTVHPKTGVVYVLNSGAVNGVQSFTFDPVHGLKSFGPFRSLHLNQTTPTTGPLNTPSRILVNSDGSKLRLAYKANMTVPGYVGTWDITHSGALGSSFTKAMPASVADGPLPFGMTNIVGAKDANLVGDAGLGAVIYDFSKPKPVIKSFPFAGQGATCWAIYSHFTGTYFLSDLGSARVYEFDIDVKTLNGTLANTYSMGLEHPVLEINIGTIHGQDYLYALLPHDSSIVTFKLGRGGKNQIIQTYNFTEPLMKSVTYDPDNLEGMVVYIKSTSS